MPLKRRKPWVVEHTNRFLAKNWALFAVVCADALSCKKKKERSFYNSGLTRTHWYKGDPALAVEWNVHRNISRNKLFVNNASGVEENDQYCLNFWKRNFFLLYLPQKMHAPEKQ